MSKLFKVVSINDGNERALQNGNRLYVCTKDRLNIIVEAMLNSGWTLLNMNQHVEPAMQKAGCFSFYLGGWDFFFTKDAAGDETDDADAIIGKAVKRSIGGEESPIDDEFADISDEDFCYDLDDVELDLLKFSDVIDEEEENIG